MKRFALALIFTLPIWATHTCTTCYIDYVGGADTNDGTTKTTGGGHGPWANPPGGNACASVCATQVPAAGDSYIFKGGVTWPTAALGINWIWSGTSTTASPGCTGSGCIYFGVDQTWYTGASWTRPIFNGGGVVVNTPSGGTANVILRLYTNYMIVDNIEFTGIYWSGAPAYGSGVNIGIAGGSPGIGTNDTIENVYIHGWSHGSSGSGTTENPCGILGDTGTPNNNVNTILINSVIDGSDTDEASCSAIFGSPPYVENNLIQYVSSGLIVDGPVQITGNTILSVVASFDSSAHENCIEDNASNNVLIANNQLGHLGSGALGIWCAPNLSYTCSIFNNILFDTDTGNVLDIAAPVINNGCAHSGSTYCNSGGATVLYNNTIECGPNSNPNAVCVAGINAAASAVTIENNHFITNATTPNGGMWSTSGVTPTVTTSLLQNLSTANGQGYTESQTYPFYPTTGGSTIGYGTDLTSLCSGTLAGLCSDSEVGALYDVTNHTVSSPNHTQVGRPSNGAWDAGAYEFQGMGSPGKICYRCVLINPR